MTIQEVLRTGTTELLTAGIDTPYLDSLVLLAEALHLSKERLLASLPDEIPDELSARFASCIAERLRGRPVSYILGRREFFGLEFTVDERVLDPRGDTETLVETALEIIGEQGGIRSLHDTCTGSGCIAIAIRHLHPEIAVSASDISAEALDLFRTNSVKLIGEPLPSRLSDLLSSVPGRFDMITANPPYLTSAETACAKRAGSPEPAIALDGGEDGLNHVRRLIGQGLDSLTPKGYLIIEAAPSQTAQIAREMVAKGYHPVTIRSDLAGRERVVTGRRGA